MLDILNSSSNKIAIFGGTFDPIHLGHLRVAMAAKKQFDLSEVHFVSAKEPPGKSKTLFDAEERYKLVEAALSDTDEITLDYLLAFKPSRIELDRDGVSYSYQTIESFKTKNSDAELFWILGIDAYLSLDSWKNTDYIKDHVTFLVYPRRSILDLEKTKELISSDSKKKAFLIEGEFQDYSSEELRERLAQNEDISDFIPGSINEMIRTFYSKKPSI